MLVATDKDFYPSCPVLDYSCPYINRLGFCMMYEESGCTPYDECDAWYCEED